MFAELVRGQSPDSVDITGFGQQGTRWAPDWPGAEAVWSSDDRCSFESDAVDTPSAATQSTKAASPGGIASIAAGAVDGAARPDGCPELGALSYSELRDRMVELVAERNRIEGEYLAVVGELTSRHGTGAVAYELRDLTRMNSSQARTESRLAHRLAAGGMSATVAALRAGEIHISHAKVIAREAPKAHRRSEASFLGLCRAYPSDTVARHTLAYESQQVYADLAAEAAAKGLGPIDAEHALQRHQRWASMRKGDDGMWNLRAKLDAITGRHLNIAPQAAVRAARHRHDNSSADTANDTGNGPDEGNDTGSEATVRAEPTHAQLTADALCDLVAGTHTARRANTSLLVIADYDTVNDTLANPRLDDGTPLSAQMLAKHATDANVLPAVFKADWSELALGRTRNASDAQRLILAARDGGCIGCEHTTEHTEAHHINHYNNGGPTDIANLASLCRPCHKDLHQHHRKITTPPNGRPRLQPPEPTNTKSSSRHPTESTATARSP